VKSLASPEFWELYRPLPANVKRDARAAYQLFQENPSHPGLHLEQINTKWGWLYSARVNARYRALAIKRADHWLWVWIGSHPDYDKLRR
jgi:hypothetical protein